jgi:hypothetical protein
VAGTRGKGTGARKPYLKENANEGIWWEQFKVLPSPAALRLRLLACDLAWE